MNALRRLSATKWLEELTAAASSLRVRVGVVPGRYRVFSEWDTQSRRLEEHLVYFFAQETARAEIAGEAFTCPRGSCCWITPGTPFRFFSDESPLVWRFRFSLTGGKKVRPLAPEQPYYFLPGTPAAAETVNALLTELSRKDPWHLAALRAWLVQLSILFFRSTRPSESRTLTAPQQNAIDALLENAPPGQGLRPRELAQAAGLTLDYFTRIFHRSHGVSPRQWIVQQRLSHAVVLLQETPLRVGEIAQRLGYAHPHLFSRQFSAHFGRSPRSFRK